MKRLLGIVIALSFAFSACTDLKEEDSKGLQARLEQEDKKDKKKKDKKDDNKKDKKDKKKDGSDAIVVLEQWEMPRELTEISGSTWYGKDKIAAVQDEVGVVFIYDLVSKEVVDKIPFSGKGDYEGVAAAGDVFYVLRSDGLIVEVKKGDAKPHQTFLRASHDTESLFYDKENNRLLVAVKASDPSSDSHKGIYSFDLSSRKMSEQPVMSVDLEHPLLSDGKKISERFQPADLAIHPLTRDVYIVDGAEPSLLVMSPQGEIKAYYKLDKSVFKQPEGITFSPAGEMYISSEGVKDSGVIVKVSINNVEKEEEI